MGGRHHGEAHAPIRRRWRQEARAHGAEQQVEHADGDTGGAEQLGDTEIRGLRLRLVIGVLSETRCRLLIAVLSETRCRLLIGVLSETRLRLVIEVLPQTRLGLLNGLLPQTRLRLLIGVSSETRCRLVLAARDLIHLD